MQGMQMGVQIEHRNTRFKGEFGLCFDKHTFMSTVVSLRSIERVGEVEVDFISISPIP